MIDRPTDQWPCGHRQAGLYRPMQPYPRSLRAGSEYTTDVRPVTSIRSDVNAPRVVIVIYWLSAGLWRTFRLDCRTVVSCILTQHTFILRNRLSRYSKLVFDRWYFDNCDNLLLKIQKQRRPDEIVCYSVCCTFSIVKFSTLATSFHIGLVALLD